MYPTNVTGTPFADVTSAAFQTVFTALGIGTGKLIDAPPPDEARKMLIFVDVPVLTSTSVPILVGFVAITVVKYVL